MEIFIPKFLEACEYRRRINVASLDDIEIVTEKGNSIILGEEKIEELKFTGLNNWDLIKIIIDEHGDE